MKIPRLHETRKWLAFGLPILAMCLIIACSKDSNDDPADDGTNPDDDPTTTEMTFTGFSPTEGEAGVTTVTLTGTNFSTTPSENSVKFGTAVATVTSAEANELQVTVPETAQTGTISITTAGTKVTSTDTFTVLDPQPEMTITGIDPMEGEWGDFIKIEGANFGDDSTEITVYINGTEASIDNFKDDAIRVQIPDDVRTGKVSITKGEQTIESENDFTVFHGRWTQLSNIEGASFGEIPTVFVKNGKGYVTMWQEENFQWQEDIWEYDPATDSWTALDIDFPGTARGSTANFVINDIAYVGAGRRNNLNYPDFWEFSFETKQWSQGETFDEVRRYLATSFSVENKGYMGTGLNNANDVSKDFWEFDPMAENEKWAQKADFGGGARYFAIGFSLGGFGYMGTGSDGLTHYKDFWKYDPDSNTWSAIANVGGDNGIPRSGATGFAIGDKGYVGLGIDDDENLLNDFWEYNQDADNWVRVADFKGVPRQIANVFVLEGKAYIFAGSNDNGYLNDVWVFDPGNSN